MINIMTKYILLIMLHMWSDFAQAQDITILQVNARWNQHNDMQIKSVEGAKIQYALLEDQSIKFRQAIKSVPVILIYKDQTLVWKKEAGLSFTLNLSGDELQRIVDKYKDERF
mgnify:CR=1 FL=1